MPTANETMQPRTGLWSLVECRQDSTPGQVFRIQGSELVVGRSGDVQVTVDSSNVSKRHAKINFINGCLMITDLGSTNGTFVNGRRVEHAALADSDLVQFADRVFRIRCRRTEDHAATSEGEALPFAMALLQFEELLNGNGLQPHFQPIVKLADATVVGSELLARSRIEQLKDPRSMFLTAATLDQECRLSEVIRERGVQDAAAFPAGCNLFVNTHPKEIVTERFLQSLYELRASVPAQKLTVEIHEAAVTDRAEMLTLRRVLSECSMQLAYDDFGAGQARLDELTEIPPEYLKFDMKLIRGIDQALPVRQQMVASLVRMVTDLGICALAEGIETGTEAEACRDLGFELAQGYFYGRPAPV